MKKTSQVICLLVFALVFIFTGCASLSSGLSSSGSLPAGPSGYNVYIDGMYIGNSPSSIVLKSGRMYNIEFTSQEEEAINIIVYNSGINGFKSLNIIYENSPVIIDAITGERYFPEEIHATFLLKRDNWD